MGISVLQVLPQPPQCKSTEWWAMVATNVSHDVYLQQSGMQKLHVYTYRYKAGNELKSAPGWCHFFCSFTILHSSFQY